ncbi:MAG: pyruvate ferredoxin oxidoreductase [Deltaproteobacteria bacterium]|nr:MAG: pyruvate ferredoxin oxidoreductase [Deltaproteobacteria bacterium]
MKTLLTGNSAASWGAKLSRVQVIAAYPITPQTSIVEELSRFCAEGELDARFIMVESEHSALSTVMGAAAAGARAFTATSSQGLLLMHEILHWVAGARLPVVMVNVNRAVAPGWNIWADQTDSLAQRDTGWAQLYCSSAQEVLDAVVIGYRIAEERRIPLLVCYDAFYISHTQEVVDVPSQEAVDRFLGEKRFPGYIHFDNPASVGSLTLPEDYVLFREDLHEALLGAETSLRSASEEFARLTGRRFDPLKVSGGGNLLVLTAGGLGGNLQVAGEMLREKGINITVGEIHLVRPLPLGELRELISRHDAVVVVERNISPGGTGILFSEASAALADSLSGKRCWNLIAGLGGLDVAPSDLVRGIEFLISTESGERIVFLDRMGEVAG